MCQEESPKVITPLFDLMPEQSLQEVELTAMKLLLQVSKEIMKHIIQKFVICLKMYIYMYVSPVLGQPHDFWML